MCVARISSYSPTKIYGKSAVERPGVVGLLRAVLKVMNDGA